MKAFYVRMVLLLAGPSSYGTGLPEIAGSASGFKKTAFRNAGVVFSVIASWGVWQLSLCYTEMITGRICMPGIYPWY